MILVGSQCGGCRVQVKLLPQITVSLLFHSELVKMYREQIQVIYIEIFTEILFRCEAGSAKNL